MSQDSCPLESVTVADAIDELVERVTVDAYGAYEQLSAFWQCFEDEARFPFPATVVGAAVEVMGVDFPGDERRGLVAICRRGGTDHLVSLIDVVPTGPMPMLTRQLLDAYRRWSGVAPPARPPTTEFRQRVAVPKPVVSGHRGARAPGTARAGRVGPGRGVLGRGG